MRSHESARFQKMLHYVNTTHPNEITERLLSRRRNAIHRRRRIKQYHRDVVALAQKVADLEEENEALRAQNKEEFMRGYNFGVRDPG